MATQPATRNLGNASKTRAENIVNSFNHFSNGFMVYNTPQFVREDPPTDSPRYETASSHVYTVLVHSRGD